jgi:hypothetical protein
MRYYLPRDDLAAVVRFRARRRKLEVMWQLLALLGMVLAASASGSKSPWRTLIRCFGSRSHQRPSAVEIP